MATGPDAELVRGSERADRDLSPIGDQNFSDHDATFAHVVERIERDYSHKSPAALPKRDRAGWPSTRYRCRLPIMLRFLTAGESHGPSLVVIIEGLPAGLPITVDEIQAELARRRLGYGPRPADALRAGRADDPRRCPPRPHAGFARWRSRSATPSGRSGPRRCRPAPGDAVEDPHRAPAGPRRPGRHAEVRLRRCP